MFVSSTIQDKANENKESDIVQTLIVALCERVCARDLLVFSA